MARWILRDNFAIGLFLMAGLILWAFRRIALRPQIALFWLLVFWVYAIVMFPRHVNLSRYTIPLMPCIALLAMAPLQALRNRLPSGFARSGLGAIAGTLVAVAAVMGQLRFQPVHLAYVDNILSMQVKMGRWVAAQLPREARIATNDVGAITYFGKRYCIDTVGLVTTEFLTHRLEWIKRHGKADPDRELASFLERARPDYCILFPSWYPTLTQQPWLRKIHQINYPNITGGGDELVAYEVVRTRIGPNERTDINE
jgi:hypothetical protein